MFPDTPGDDAIRFAFSLAFAFALIMPCGPLPEASASPTVVQDDQTSLADLEADYMVLMSEADALGRGTTISQSIRYSTPLSARTPMTATSRRPAAGVPLHGTDGVPDDLGDRRL